VPVPFPILPRLRGENSVTRAGADEIVGILRLHMRIGKANPHAPLGMTGQSGVPQRLKPRSWLGTDWHG